MKPLIFCIEGIDCVGKSSLSKKIMKIMNNSKVKIIHFPRYETELGKKIKDVLHSDDCDDSDKLQYYYLADQISFSKELSDGKYDEYDILILDRFFLSTSAYSLTTDKKIFKNIYTLHKVAIKSKRLVVPDYTILITLNDDADESIFNKRLNSKKDKDVFEKHDFLLKVNSNYKTAIDLYGDMKCIKYSLSEVNDISEDKLYEIFI